VPYGAVASYAASPRARPTLGGARGGPGAASQSPADRGALPPHHRQHGKLVGYAGNRVALKEQLLGVEGVPVNARAASVERGAMYHYDPNRITSTACRRAGAFFVVRSVRFASSRIASRPRVGPRALLDCRPDLHPLSR